MAPKTRQQNDPRLNNPLQNLQQAFGFGPKPSGPGPARSFNPSQATAQQAVLDNLRAGGVLRNPQPANPFEKISNFFTDTRVPGQPGLSRRITPNLGAARLNGEEILINRNGISELNSGVEINVGGQRFFPAQRGQDLIYRRGVDENNKRAVGGQYGNLLPRDSSQIVSTAGTDYQPAAERSYQQEVSRTAQLTAQDPELQRYEKARKIAAAQGATPESVKTAEDIGMQIFAKKYGGPGGLASKVKPGQAGYEAIQGVIAPGRGMPGSTNLYKGAFPGDDYRDYGEPPTGAAAIPGFNTPAITGVAAQTIVPQLDPAQMQAQDLVESFKKGVFDPDLMEQIASSIYNR